MPSPRWERLDDFLVSDDHGGFASAAVITLASGTVLPVINVIFDDPIVDDSMGEYTMDLSNPRVGCKETDVVGVAKFDTIAVGVTIVRGIASGGTVYDIIDNPQLDGSGWATLKLAPPSGS